MDNDTRLNVSSKLHKNKNYDLSRYLDSPVPVTWLFTGDSITQGAKHTRGFRDYTQLFKERLGELGRNEDIVINTAVGGWGIQSLYDRFQDRIQRFCPDVLFMMFGTNDAARGQNYLNSYLEIIQKTIEAARIIGIKTIIVQNSVPISPVNPETYINLKKWDSTIMKGNKLNGLCQRIAHLEQYSLALISAASAWDVLLIDHYRAWKHLELNQTQLMDGGFHPNEYGHRQIARTIFEAFNMWDSSSWTCQLFIPT